MKKELYLLLLCSFFWGNALHAQIPNFADDIAPIIWGNCATCHHNGGLPNTTFLSYQEVQPWAADIKMRINTTDAFLKMPPWSPDPNYRSFAHERVLTSSEIAKITSWVDNGTPPGDTANMVSPPSFGNGSFIQSPPDLTLRMPAYASKASSSNDDYVCFVLPTGLTTAKYIKAIEVIPGNSDIVHHVNIGRDGSGFTTDTVSGTCISPATSSFISGYVPGARPVIFPNGNGVNMGIRLDSSENIVMSLHYPAGSAGLWDSTAVNFYFYDDTTSNIRIVNFATSNSNSSFCISANTVDSIQNFSGVVGSDYSLISIVPHCHLLGQSFMVYIIDPVGDTIPLVSIPQWNFEWQDFYYFKNLLKIEAGSDIFAKAVYDNTTSNSFNPNTPPQTVCVGQQTTDEMFAVYLNFVTYQAGDENIDIESITNLITDMPRQKPKDEDFDLAIFPNPTQGKVNISYSLDQDENVDLLLYNMQGQLVKAISIPNQTKGIHNLTWEVGREAGINLSTGLYLIHMRVGNKSISKKLLFQRN